MGSPSRVCLCCVSSVGKAETLYPYAAVFACPAVKMDLWLFISESEITSSCVAKYYTETLSRLSFISPMAWGGKHFSYVHFLLLSESEGPSRQRNMRSCGWEL